MILVGNKKDLRTDQKTIDGLKKGNQSPVTYEQGQAMAEKIGAIAYIECSAKTREVSALNILFTFY